MSEYGEHNRRFSVEARALIRARNRERGLTFEVFLPTDLADWLRQQISTGVFEDESEAALVAFQDLQALSRHPTARQALLDAMLNTAISDPRESTTLEDLRAEYEAHVQELASEPLHPPSASQAHATIASFAADPAHAALYGEEVASTGSADDMRIALERLSRALRQIARSRASSAPP